jgi:hypothetical protein
MLTVAERKEIEQWIEDQVAKLLPDEVKRQMQEVPVTVHKDHLESIYLTQSGRKG